MIREIDIITGPPGCGKTRVMVAEMAAVPARYVLASPRIDLVRERARDLRVAAAAAGTAPLLVEAHGGTGLRGPVARQIVDAAGRHAGDHHAILVVTHEGLMAADPAALAGWHARIDEVPGAVLSDAFGIGASTPLFEAGYALEPAAAGWSRVVPLSGAPGLAAILRDTLAAPLAAFHKRARSPAGVKVDVAAWADAGARPVRWWSAWTPLELRACASVAIAATGFLGSVAHAATVAAAGEEVVFRRRAIPRPAGPADGPRPRVAIRYFVRAHRASTAFWGTGEGRRCLDRIGRWLEADAPGLGYWSGNTVVTDYLTHRVPGLMVRPRQEGTNALIDHASCAFLYSAKTVPGDAPLLEVLGLDRGDVERAREVEDVRQFVLRGALRRPDFAGEYRVWVYDEAQAGTLARYLHDEGIGEVDVAPEPGAGVLDVGRPQRGRPRAAPEVDPGTRAERAAAGREADRERQRRRRERERAERAAAGTLRPRGRPRKAPIATPP